MRLLHRDLEENVADLGVGIRKQKHIWKSLSAYVTLNELGDINPCCWPFNVIYTAMTLIKGTGIQHCSSVMLGYLGEEIYSA